MISVNFIMFPSSLYLYIPIEIRIEQNIPANLLKKINFFEQFLQYRKKCIFVLEFTLYKTLIRTSAKVRDALLLGTCVHIYTSMCRTHTYTRERTREKREEDAHLRPSSSKNLSWPCEPIPFSKLACCCSASVAVAADSAIHIHSCIYKRLNYK